MKVVLEEVERRCTKGPAIVVTVFLGLCLGDLKKVADFRYNKPDIPCL